MCGARRKSQGIEDTDGVPLNSSVVQIQTVAKALGPKDIERLSQVYRQHAHIFLNLEEH